MPWVFLWVVLGLCFGSFTNVLIYRLPRNISIVMPPSACPACNCRIAYYDLLPVISWLLLKGCCRNCKIRISLRYPLVELACALLFAGMILFTRTPSAIFLSFFAFVLLTISLIDWETQVIPDGLLAVALVVGVMWVALGNFFMIFPYAPGFVDALLGLIAGAIPLYTIDKLMLIFAKKDGFGYGDVKLMAVAGLYLGWNNIFLAFIFAFVAGGVFAVFLLITGRAKRGEYIAFGPFLCGGTLAALWFGQAFWSFLT
ncbi:MAG: prepilin peptidase [Defluviitaleaceae bacterium]|nr:prepilin peptidase [Defluviitaleaceae bacterium]